MCVCVCVWISAGQTPGAGEWKSGSDDCSFHPNHFTCSFTSAFNVVSGLGTRMNKLKFCSIVINLPLIIIFFFFWFIKLCVLNTKENIGNIKNQHVSMCAPLLIGRRIEMQWFSSARFLGTINFHGNVFLRPIYYTSRVIFFQSITAMYTSTHGCVNYGVMNCVLKSLNV